MRQRVQGLRNGKADGGFTLIELLIVIIVLGILAGIAVFGVAQFREDAEAAACEADVKTVQTAAEAYFAKNDAYPANVTALVPAYLKTAPAATSGIAIAADGTVTGTC